MNAPRVRTACAVSTLLIAGLGTTHQALAADESPHSLKANVALTSNYLFRGISQTNNGPAVQGGFDYTYVPWSLYVGAWGSNVDSSSGVGTYVVNNNGDLVVTGPDTPNAEFLLLEAPGYDGASMELDIKAGWAPTFGKLGIDLGYIRYQYPMTKTDANNTNEYHLGLSYDILGYVTPKFVANYSDNFYGLGVAWYYDLTVAVPLPYAFSLSAHYGWTRYNNSVNHGGGYSYDDYSVSLSREVYNGVVLAVSWVDRNNTDLCAPPFQCGSTGVVTLSKSF